MKTLIASLTVCGGAALLAAGTAQADMMTFTYAGATVSATGSLDCSATGEALSGSVTLTGTAGMDGTYTLEAGAGSNSQFIWDNLVDCDGAQYLTSNGLYFKNALGHQVNIWGNAPGNYSLYGHNGSGYMPEDNGGEFALVIPGPGTLVLLGVAGLVGSRRRR